MHVCMCVCMYTCIYVGIYMCVCVDMLYLQIHMLLHTHPLICKPNSRKGVNRPFVTSLRLGLSCSAYRISPRWYK